MIEFIKVYNNNQIMPSMLKQIDQTTIYFGHRSVGNNILGGINEWEKDAGIQLNIVDSDEFSEVKSPAFVHFRIGENGDPIGKIDAFVSAIARISNDTFSLAFFKFCFADISDTTQINPLFNYFKEQMLYLKDNYPNIKIILVTAPYTSIQKGMKAIIKRALLMPLGGQMENMRRSEFNDRMVNEMGNEFPIFDLARVESTLPKGEPNTYNFKGNTYPALADIYTHDQCHLNDYGSKIAAYNLIAFLSHEINNN